MKFTVYSVFMSTPMENYQVHKVDEFSSMILNPFFSDKDYGKDVEEIAIHIRLEPPTPFSLEGLRKPRFYEKSDDWVKRFEIDSITSQEDFNQLLNASDNEIDGIIARHIIQWLIFVDRLPKRLKDFDRERFKTDVEDLFRSHGWL